MALERKLKFTKEQVLKKINTYETRAEFVDDVDYFIHEACQPFSAIQTYYQNSEKADEVQSAVNDLRSKFKRFVNLYNEFENKKEIVHDLYQAMQDFQNLILNNTNRLLEENATEVFKDWTDIDSQWRTFLGEYKESDLGKKLWYDHQRKKRDLEEKGILYEMFLPKSIPAKIDYFSVINNLVWNAVKYAFPNGKERKYIRVEGWKDKEKEHFVINVMDNGIGIPQENLEKIFEKGFTSGKQECHGLGKGIGLYQAKKIVENNGGEIKVVSNPGYITAFTFTIPFENLK